jgi:hypothetical protein
MDVQNHRFGDYRPSCRLRRATRWLWGMLLVVGFVGCGTTRSSDTSRTATEQLLISDAIDRAVVALNINSLSGQAVFFDDQYLHEAVDSGYLISSIRQHLLANGCVLKDERADADFVVEGRSGAVGTNRHDLLFGIPSTNVPQIFPLQGIPAAIPEVPFAKRRDQRGVAKIAMFAYHRETGRPVWQSGIALQESTLNDVWLLGAGPFQYGTIHNDPLFAEKQVKGAPEAAGDEAVGITKEITFVHPAILAGNLRRMPASKIPASKSPASKSPVELAGYTVGPVADGPADLTQSPGIPLSDVEMSLWQLPGPINGSVQPGEFQPAEDCLPMPLPVSALPRPNVD